MKEFYSSGRNSGKTKLFEMRMKGYERYIWKYTIENGKVKKIGYSFRDISSMYPSLLKRNPLL